MGAEAKVEDSPPPEIIALSIKLGDREEAGGQETSAHSDPSFFCTGVRAFPTEPSELQNSAFSHLNLNLKYKCNFCLFPSHSLFLSLYKVDIKEKLALDFFLPLIYRIGYPTIFFLFQL